MPLLSRRPARKVLALFGLDTWIFVVTSLDAKAAEFRFYIDGERTFTKRYDGRLMTAILMRAALSGQMLGVIVR